MTSGEITTTKIEVNSGHTKKKENERVCVAKVGDEGKQA